MNIYSKASKNLKLKGTKIMITHYTQSLKSNNNVENVTFPQGPSRGEIIAANHITSMKREFHTQVFNYELLGVNGDPLLFDFAVYLKNIPSMKFYFVEIDGPQHFKPIPDFGGEKTFIIIKEHDRRKNQFCKENGILLIRIPTYDYYRFITPYHLSPEVSEFNMVG